MEQIILNNAFSLECPEGFRILSEEEVKQMNNAGSIPQHVIRSEERKIVGSFAWHQENAFSALLLNAKDMAKKLKEAVAKANQPYQYIQGETFNEKYGDAAVSGMYYGYTAQETEMEGLAGVFKKGKVFYYIYFYYRRELKEQSLAVIREILDSIKEL